MTKNKQGNDLAISFLLLMITLSIFPKLMFGKMEPVQSLAQCFGSACGSSVIINGPTPSTRYEDLAEPSGMPFKVAACFCTICR